MELTTVWFALIAVLWIGYFTLEGFDFGVGMLLPVLAKDETERRVLINTIGPVWDGNEVWVLVAGGATFAAFPEWYATLFSGFYLPLLLILVALIVRGVAFEYRAKGHLDQWRDRWDAAIVIGSFIPSLLWGVAFANILRGVPPSLPLLTVALGAVLERHAAHDQRQQDQQQRQVEPAEQGRVPLGERREGRAAGHEEPDLVAVPDRADGVDHDPALGFVLGQDGQQHADPEVEALEGEVADPEDCDQREPDSGELHGDLLSTRRREGGRGRPRRCRRTCPGRAPGRP